MISASWCRSASFVPPMFGWIKKVSSEAGDFEPGDKG